MVVACLVSVEVPFMLDRGTLLSEGILLHLPLELSFGNPLDTATVYSQVFA